MMKLIIYARNDRILELGIRKRMGAVVRMTHFFTRKFIERWEANFFAARGTVQHPPASKVGLLVIRSAT